MRVNEAIAQANALRLNALDDGIKAGWLYELDCDIAEMMGADAPENSWPTEDRELLMPSPHDNIYPLYAAAMIDYANQESDLYQNDLVMFNSAYSDATAWWRRHHDPKKGQRWKAW